MDTPDDPPPPPLDVRWMHLGTPYLDLLGVPVPAPATIYAPFSASESSEMEARWLALPEEDRVATRKMSPSPEEVNLLEKEWKRAAEKGKGKEQHGVANVAGEPEAETPPNEKVDKAEGGGGYVKKRKLETRQTWEDVEKLEEEEMGVPVAKDGLFEADVRNMKLFPVFWNHRGPNIPIRRCRWFFDKTRPCPEELSDELEEGYLKIKPWVPSYEEELSACVALGKEAEAKLRYELVKSRDAVPSGGGPWVIYQDDGLARIVSESMSSKISKALWTALRSGAAHVPGTFVFRGYDSAVAGLAPATSGTTTPRSGRALSISSAPSKERSHSASSINLRRSVEEFRAEDKRGAADVKSVVRNGLDAFAANENGLVVADMSGEGIERPAKENGKAAEPSAPQVTDLVLIVHGIGQQLANTYEGFSFVYAANILRKEAQKQALSPALASIMRDRQAQFLPIQWRADLSLGQGTEEEGQEDIEHELDNSWDLNDITLRKTIPYVRELTNKVLLDIPYFMTARHKESMIEAVVVQCNRTYRRWCRRHPEFEKKGRVHIIAHSLGSALVANILSEQETIIPRLSELPKEVAYNARESFIFNTHALFLVGSPLGLFLHLHSAQLVPRKGRERTRASPKDEALDRAGRFGCLAVDSIYNIFHPSDPIAYMLNATVDSRLAKSRPPLAISSVTAGIMDTFTETVGRGVGSLSKMFDGLPKPFRGSMPGKRPETIRLPSGLELSGPPGKEQLKGSKAERRFSALNPHGNLDFVLQSTGMISEYYDALTAHGDYWGDSSFAAFILAEIFANKEDLIRTGMGAPASQAALEDEAMLVEALS